MILADEMGLGKTLSALVTAKKLLKRGKIKQVLIVVPAFLLLNWVEEAKMLNIKLHIFAGKKRKYRNKKWIITSYTTLAKDIEEFNALHADLALILDEAHYIKKRLTKRSESIFRIIASRKYLLTGTPVDNAPDDLWNIIRLIAPRLAGSEESWQRKFCVMKNYKLPGGRYFTKAVRYKNLDVMHKMLGNLMLRRTKEECLDLPPKQVIHKSYSLNDETLYWFESIKSLAEEEEWPIGKTLIRLSQVLDGVIKTGENIDYYKSSKFQLLLHMLESRSGKVIVWFKHKKIIPQIVNQLKANYNVTPQVITGDVGMYERHIQLDKWRRKENGILLATIKAAGVGLNLTNASTAIFYSFEYVPNLNKQAEDRIYRIGQKKKTTVYYLYAPKTIEHATLDLMKSKTLLNKAVVEGPMEKKLMQKIYDKTYTLFGQEGLMTGYDKYNYYMREER